jgi:hypothetical protein
VDHKVVRSRPGNENPKGVWGLRKRDVGRKEEMSFLKPIKHFKIS